MIKWILTTFILVVVVAALTIVLQTPSLRNKSASWLEGKISLMSKRAGEVKGIIDRKTGAKTDEAEQAGPASDKKAGAAVKTVPAPPPKSADDQIPDSDKKKLEQVLEKANRTGKSK
jgi:hypothetical protein